ncbi:MAG TPA: alpha-amylase family protein [Opitutus sp.]|nr:alpha-amylase family protein [Opitutus sp.]
MPATAPLLDRREFLRNGAIVVGGLTLAPLLVHGSPSETASTPAPASPDSDLWFRRPLRILQTVLREPDARGYDAAAVVRYLQDIACNTLVINGGGIVDFFRNPLPLANPDPFMGDRDLLHDISTACRAAGIRVIARVDYRGVEERLYRLHPDWFAVAADGGPLLLDYTQPKLCAGCYTCYYRNEHGEELIRYLLDHYPIDGIWHNSVAVAGICHCPRCRDAFAADAHAPLPDETTASPAELDRYMQWKARAADRHVARMCAAVKSFGPDKAYAAEVFGSMFASGGRIWSGIDLYSARDHFDFLIATAFISENNADLHYDPIFHSATLVRMMKSLTPDKEAVILYGDNGTSHRYIMDAPVDTRVWLWEALSVGGRFWNCSFTGMDPAATHDRRTAFNSVPVYSFVRDHEAALSHHVPVANVGIYYSRATRQFYRQPSPDGDRFGAAIQGVERTLLEGHIPYDFIPDDQLTAEKLARYRVVILPNVRCLGDAEIAAFRDYVRAGGGLVATFATSLDDSAGSPRRDFGLADVFGCMFTGTVADTRKDTYQFIFDARHPLVAPDSARTDLLLTYGHTLLCHAQGDAVVICTHVPTINNQPPEKAWVQAWSTEFPTILENRFGAGRCIYFANEPGQNTHDMGHPDVQLPLERAVRYLAGDTLPIAEAVAPASVHLGLTRSLVKPGEFIVSFVNTSSAPVRPLRELIPVSDLSVTLRLGAALDSHEVLRTQGACRVTADEGLARVELARLEDFAAVHLRLRA